MSEWVVILLDEVEDWYLDLSSSDAETVGAAIQMLEEQGPTLGRPLVDRIKASSLHNLKELRPGSSGTTEFRILFMFDPKRQAILLTAGDKAGNWKGWYVENVPVAEDRYLKWLEGGYS